MTEDSARLQYLLEPLAHAHAAHLGSDAVVVEAVLPDPFEDEAVGLVVAGDHGGDEQVGGLCGAMSNMERIHAKGARWELCAFY
jgi:hypothetical protein